MVAVAMAAGCGTVCGAASCGVGPAPGAPCDAACIMAKQAVQGEHHPVHRDLGMTPDGRDLVIDDVIIGVDRIAILYHATGIQSTMPRGEQSPTFINPAFGLEGPTLIRATADGNTLQQMDGSQGGQSGMATMTGNAVYRLDRPVIHHLDISIVRILGDEKATWTTAIDF